MRQEIVKILPGLALALVVAALGVYLFLNPRAPAGQDGSGLPANPSVMGTLQASTQESVTIAQDGGKKKTFSISTTTQVVTQVRSGEVGRTLQEIATGTLVLVQPHAPRSTAADRISVMPEPSVFDTDPLGPPVILSGTVVATTTTGITIATAADPNLSLSISASTAVLSNVLAGQRGKVLEDIAAGSFVTVSGLTTANGLLVRSILLLSVIQ